MGENDKNHESWGDPRFLIALVVLGISICGIIVLSLKVLMAATPSDPKENLETAKTVFSSILPVLATWVGTVLAFYFSRENFESANRNVREMVKKITSMEKLQSVSVSEVMIPIKDMACFRFSAQKPEESKVLLSEDLIGVLREKNRNRLPILDQTDKPKYLIHRSLIDRFFSEKSLPPVPAVPSSAAPAASIDIAKLTLKDIIESSSDDIKKFIKVSFGTVKQTDSLADAKREMEREQGRLDVLVTKDGTPNSPVVGWITNVIISENATV